MEYYEKYQGGLKIIPHVAREKFSRDIANENIFINFTNLPNKNVLTNGVSYTSIITLKMISF